MKKIKSGGALSDKDIKDIIAALKKYKHENIRLGELMPGMHHARGACRGSKCRLMQVCICRVDFIMFEKIQ